MGLCGRMLYHHVRLQESGLVPVRWCVTKFALQKRQVSHTIRCCGTAIYLGFLPAKQGVEISFINRDFLGICHVAGMPPFEVPVKSFVEGRRKPKKTKQKGRERRRDGLHLRLHRFVS